jgi:Ca-activated chloride channel family protein
MTPRPHRQLRRQLESELRDAPASPPPADLLAKIQAEIPADRHAANSPAPPAGGRFTATAGLRLAASLAVAAIGVVLAFRTAERAERTRPAEDRPSAFAASPAPPREHGVQLETGSVQELAEETKAERLPGGGRTGESGGEGAAAEPALPRAAPLRVAEAPSASGRRDRTEKRVLAETAPSAAPRPATPAREADSSLRALGYAAPVPEPSEGAHEVRQRTIAPPLSARIEEAERKAEIDAPAPPAIAEEITITAESPVLDARRSKERRQSVPVGPSELERVPTARDPWVILQETPGAPVDRVDAGEGAPPSTGGEREPNEQAVGDMFFRPAGTNPFVDTSEDRLSTFALDVDTGSWNLAKAYLERGTLPPPQAIRVEEFVNAQAYGDPAPRRGDFTLIAEGAPSPFAPGERYRLVRFAVKARAIDERDRKPANLTFVVDVSGSMERENRLGLVQQALLLLLDELSGDDRVALVVYGTRGRVLLHHTRDHRAIREAIAALRAEGSTNAEEGLRLGYDLAGEAWRRDAIHRVILCSDGVANVGATGPESILERIGREARRGIELTTVGFGMGNYNDALMEQLADQGDGAYHYVDSLEEARRIFVENLTGTLQTVAQDAKVQVEFDPRVADRWRLVGYENRDVADRDFRNDAVDAGELGAGHSAVALYEVRLRSGVRGGDPVGTLRLRWKSRATRRVEEAALTLAVDDLEDSFRRASRELRTAAVAAELAERLKRSYWAKEGSWSDLVRAAERLEAERGRDGRPLADLARRAARLAAEPGVDPGDRPIRYDDERREEE